MPKVKNPDERKQYEEWQKLCESYNEKYGPIFQSIVDDGELTVDLLKSHDLFGQIKKSIAEAYNLLMETKKRFYNSKNREITEIYKKFISEMCTNLFNLNKLYIFMVKNLNT
jgi:hypothetical protein